MASSLAGPLALLRRRGFVAATTHADEAFVASLKSRFPAWWDAVAPVFEHEHAHGASDAWDGARRAVASSGLSSGDIPAVYIGFDPTADSLHVGNMLQMSALRALQASGFRPLVLVGGATGLIGDPSGRSTERNLMMDATLATNVAGIKRSLACLVDFSCPVTGAHMVNNADFYADMSAIEFIRDIGRHFRVSSMLGKDSVKSRLDSGSGLSFTEFSYQLFQANDFLRLFQDYNCVMQVGGADQWGNITAGLEMIRKVAGADAMGVTVPLLLTPSGEKYGKSAGNAVWINEDRTSSYALYQHFLHTPDSELDNLLRLFTTLSEDDMQALMAEHEQMPGKRVAQQALAREITTAVRGESAVASAEAASRAMFGGALEGIKPDDFDAMAAEVPSNLLPIESVVGSRLADVVVASGASKSKGEVKRLVKAGGLYLNNERVTNAMMEVESSHLISGTALLLRTGKKRITLVRVASE